MRKLCRTLLVLATCLTSARLLAADASTNDPFSEIPVSETIVSRLPDPEWSPPRVSSTLYELEYPQSFFKKSPQGCGITRVAVRVLANGDFAEAKLASSSGFDNLDNAVLKYVAKGQRYEPARFDGKPMEGWLLYLIKFAGDESECKSKPESSAETSPVLAQYNAPMKALIEQARAKNIETQAEQQKAFDAQEQKRYASEEPYRQRISAKMPVEWQAKYASELYHNFVHCGDMRYDRQNSEIIQLRGAAFYFKDADELNELDLANGYEWRGRVGLYCKMKRTYRFGGGRDNGWSDWEYCSNEISRVWKRHGKWHVETPGDERPRPRLSCADVPPG